MKNKAKVKDTVRAVINRRDAHELSTEERVARARNRDLRQLRAERAEKGRQLEVLQADVARLDAEIGKTQMELDTALGKL